MLNEIIEYIKQKKDVVRRKDIIQTFGLHRSNAWRYLRNGVKLGVLKRLVHGNDFSYQYINKKDED